MSNECYRCYSASIEYWILLWGKSRGTEGLRSANYLLTRESCCIKCGGDAGDKWNAW